MGHKMIEYNHYPFKVDGRGRSATATADHHIKQMIEQVLFTALGERVNRPTFGSGINQLVFAPNSNELAAATQFLVQGALQQWLGELIHVETVAVKNEESTLMVVVHYTIKRTQERHTVEFARGV
jgi:phage baseplate assembly protein W